MKRLTVIIGLICISAVAGLGYFFFFKLIYNNESLAPESSRQSAVNDSPAEPAKSPLDASGRSYLPLEEKAQDATLIAVGDVMLSRNVAAQIKKHKDINYPFLKTQDYLKSADMVFGNLESPITAGPVVPTGSMVFHADPGVENALEDANFSILSLANNHIPNYGAKGIEDTIKYLKQAGIQSAGAGANDAEAFAPAYLETEGIKLAFLAYNDSDVVPSSYGASTDHAGTALMNTKKIIESVKAAKEQVDLVIVSMHSGTEYKEANQRQIDFAHAAIDAGAEMVIGHHPHVVQRAEKYKDKYIFYSLGNFVFDQMWSQATREGIAIKIFFNKTGVTNIEPSAILIENYSQPRLLDGAEADKIIKKLKL